MNRTANMAFIGPDCVACGCCMTVCPKSAINIRFGISAQIDGERCIGCGKCAKACPAALIRLVEREAVG